MLARDEAGGVSALAMPAARFVGRFVDGSEEWHAARRHGVGGSEVAALLGISPWESWFSLWHRKRGSIPPLDLSDEMEWGKRLEPMIAAKYADEHPDEELIEVGTWCHENRPWQVVNPDRARRCRATGKLLGPLEIKYSLFGDDWGDPGTDQIPPYYRPQAIWYADGLGFDHCNVAVFIGGSATYREYRITFQATEAAFLRECAKDFLDDLDTGTLPDLDGHTATYQAVKELHPEIDAGETVDISDPVAEAFKTACAGEASAKAAKRQAAGAVLLEMGTANYAYHQGRKLARRQSNGDGTPFLVAERNLAKECTAA
jgi:putative phage-type endonuclease